MTRRNPLPPFERLHQLFVYEPDTGLLRWKINRAQMRAGDIAGSLRDTGYICVGVDDKLYRVHLIAWKMMTGEEPKSFIDHEDTIKSNNRWTNLREATKSQNQANIGLIKTNTSGLKGVSPYRQGERWGKPWQSAIMKDGKHYHVGHFATKEEAYAAYCEVAKRLFGEFARVA